MLALIVALALASAPPPVDRDNASTNGDVRMDDPTPQPPGGARRQAETAVREGLADPAGAVFHDERVTVVTSVKRGAFGSRIDGPVSIVCGKYGASAQTPADGFAWFFVAIKRGAVLWADVDEDADGSGAAYLGCKNAGLAS